MVKGAGVFNKTPKRLAADNGAQKTARMLRDVQIFLGGGKLPVGSKPSRRSREPTSGPVAPWSEYPLPSLNMQSSSWGLSISTNKQEVVRMLERHSQHAGLVCWWFLLSVCVCVCARDNNSLSQNKTAKIMATLEHLLAFVPHITSTLRTIPGVWSYCDC